MKGNFNKLVKGSQPVLVDFFADWCGPCHTQAPILKDLASDSNNKAKVVKVNVDKNQAIANKFQIRSIPTLILFKNGKPVWRHSGVMGKQQLMQVINQKG